MNSSDSEGLPDTAEVTDAALHLVGRKSPQHLSKSKKVPAAVPYLTLDLCIADLVALGTAYRPVVGLGCSKRYDSRQHLTKPADLWRTGRADSAWHVSFGWRRKPAATLPPDICPVRWARFAAVFTAATVSCHFDFSDSLTAVAYAYDGGCQSKTTLA